MPIKPELAGIAYRLTIRRGRLGDQITHLLRSFPGTQLIMMDPLSYKTGPGRMPMPAVVPSAFAAFPEAP